MYVPDLEGNEVRPHFDDCRLHLGHSTSITHAETRSAFVKKKKMTHTYRYFSLLVMC